MSSRSHRHLIVIALLIAITTPCTVAAPRQTLSVNLQPTEAVLTPTEQISFTLSIRTADGEVVDALTASVRWQVVGKIGTIAGDGVFTAAANPGRGMIRVIVTMPDAQGVAHALIKVGQAPTTNSSRRVRVVLSPNAATVPPGGSAQFVVEPPAEVSWRVIPPRIGNVSPTGLFVAGKSTGRGIIIATVRTDQGIGTSRANIYVGEDQQVHHGPKLDIVVHPRHTQMQPGESTVLTAEVAGQQADQPHVPYIWNVTPSYLGKITSVAPNQATFTAADKSGRALVTASFRTDVQIGMGWSMVDIGQAGKGEPMRMQTAVPVRILPDDITVDVGETVFFDANTEEGSQPVWSVVPSQIGTVDRNGIFTPLTPGWGLVIARSETAQGMRVGQARVFVGTAKQRQLRVTISPTALEVEGGSAPVPLTAQVTTSTGEPVPNARLSWQVFPMHLGRIDAKGVFTPGAQLGNGLIRVSAQTPTGSGSTQIRVSVGNGQGSKKLTVSVSGPRQIKVGVPVTFTARVTGRQRTPANATNIQITWSVQPVGIGTIVAVGSSATFTPAQKGQAVITASIAGPEGSGIGRISVTVE